MKTKKELYLKQFVYALVVFQGILLASMILFFVSPDFNGDVRPTINLGIIIDIPIIILIVLLYVHDPDPTKIPSKEKFSKIGPKHAYALFGFTLLTIVAFILPLGYEYLMPFPFFFGILAILITCIWFLMYHNDTIQIFNVIDMYIKDQLYPGTWVAEARQKDRELSLENEYKGWLYDYGSTQEREYYRQLSGQSSDAGREYAISRINQIMNNSNQQKSGHVNTDTIDSEKTELIPPANFENRSTNQKIPRITSWLINIFFIVGLLSIIYIIYH